LELSRVGITANPPKNSVTSLLWSPRHYSLK